jgi:DNA-binding response OmpR family regulator
MPDMKGDQVLEALRHDPATAAIPVILLTGYDESVTSEMKADAVVTKPFDIKHILEVVRSLLQNNPGSPLKHIEENSYMAKSRTSLLANPETAAK